MFFCLIHVYLFLVFCINVTCNVVHDLCELNNWLETLILLNDTCDTEFKAQLSVFSAVDASGCLASAVDRALDLVASLNVTDFRV